jgi:hypothetical protein
VLNLGTNSTTVNATGVVVSAYTVVAGVGAGSIAFQFNGVGSIPVPYPIVANIRVATAANVNVDLADAVITYPSNGVVTISSGCNIYSDSWIYILCCSSTCRFYSRINRMKIINYINRSK